MLADFFKKIKSQQEELWFIFVVLLAVGLILGLWKRQFDHQTFEPLRIENVLSDLEKTDKPLGEPTNSLTVFGNFVASRNGSKYYLANCAGVKRIKEENKIWFRSKTEAEERGLTPAANCPGL